jgi:predicted acylesterase/phospholipase RssA
MKLFRALVLAATCGAASGCQIKPVQYAGTPAPEPRCSAIRTRITIDVPHANLAPGPASPNRAASESEALTASILADYRSAAQRAGPTGSSDPKGPVSPSMLLLSGGSQNGAFGAGFLDGWHKARRAKGGLPRFRVVAGISTGALQSTFAFLRRPEKIVEAYDITHERDLLNTYVSGGLKSKSALTKIKAGLAIANKGALADLDPLRATIRQRITPEVLSEIADEADAGRRLLVGAVEMDTGDAYLFDLTKAAVQYSRGHVTAMKDCYVEALIASSSVPMSALPAFIDGRMYIDGGARFGVISDFTDRLFSQAAQIILAKDPKNLFVLVNGTLEVTPTCYLAACPPGGRPETPPGVVPLHVNWSFDKLALRSMSVLINQSYRSSVYWTTREAKDHGYVPYFTRIEPDLPSHPFNGKRCDEWAALDDDRDHPLEFHPDFMRCEIDYGRSRSTVLQWAGAE